jgi:DNA-binding GntR family transcriptional regulator
VTQPQPGKSLVEDITTDLREKILGGVLTPGQRISQVAIARTYGVSRLPVREALRLLVGESLIEAEHGKEARVASLDFAELREVYRMREALEPMAMALAVERVTEFDIATAEQLLQKISHVPDGSPEWLKLDREFHWLWYSLLPMPRLLRTIEQLLDVAQRYRAAFNLTPGMRNVSDLEHWMLLEAMKGRQAEDAKALLQVHLRHVPTSLETPTAATFFRTDPSDTAD